MFEHLHPCILTFEHHSNQDWMLAYILTAIFRNLEYNIVRVAECVCWCWCEWCREWYRVGTKENCVLKSVYYWCFPDFHMTPWYGSVSDFHWNLWCVGALDFQTIPILLTHNIVNFMKTSKSGLIIWTFIEYDFLRLYFQTIVRIL